MQRLINIINLIFTIIGIFSIPLALTSFFLFDAPGSENNTFVWVTFWSALALPITCLISIVSSSYIMTHSQNFKKALLISLIPCLVIATLIGSMTMIQVFCNGNFSC